MSETASNIIESLPYVVGPMEREWLEKAIDEATATIHAQLQQATERAEQAEMEARVLRKALEPLRCKNPVVTLETFRQIAEASPNHIYRLDVTTKQRYQIERALALPQLSEGGAGTTGTQREEQLQTEIDRLRTGLREAWKIAAQANEPQAWNALREVLNVGQRMVYVCEDVPIVDDDNGAG